MKCVQFLDQPDDVFGPPFPVSEVNGLPHENATHPRICGAGPGKLAVEGRLDSLPLGLQRAVMTLGINPIYD